VHSLREFVYLPSSWPPASASPASPVANSQNADFAAIYGTSALPRSPNRACHPMGRPHGPPGAQGAPNGSQRSPRMANGSPQAGQRGPKAPQRVTKGAPKASQGDPSGGPRWPKGAPRAQLYEQTPDQPPKRPLC